MLIKQRKLGHTVKRHALNKKSYSHYERITSDASLTKHLSVSRQFAAYIVANRPNNRDDFFNVAYAKRFLQDAANKGLAPKTIKGYVTTVNHLLVGQGLLHAADSLSGQSLGLPKINSHARYYKPLTSSEWRSQHEQTYIRHQQLIDTARAFGLRREGLLGNGHQKLGLTPSSFIRMDSGQMAVATVEKGGKLRLAPCREDLASTMERYYGKYADADEVVLDNHAISRFEVAKEPIPGWPVSDEAKLVTTPIIVWKEPNPHWDRAFSRRIANEGNAFLKDQAGEKPLLQESGKNIPLHIFRAEYAQNLLKQQNQVYISHFGRLPSQANYMGYSKLRGSQSARERDYSSTRIPQGGELYYVQALRDVAIALGHNRLDVLSKYI